MTRLVPLFVFVLSFLCCGQLPEQGSVMPRNRDAFNWGLRAEVPEAGGSVVLAQVELDDDAQLGGFWLNVKGPPAETNILPDYLCRVEFGQGGVSNTFFMDFRIGVGIYVPGSVIRVWGLSNSTLPAVREISAQVSRVSSGQVSSNPTLTVVSESVAPGGTWRFDASDRFSEIEGDIPPYTQAARVQASLTGDFELGWATPFGSVAGVFSQDDLAGVSHGVAYSPRLNMPWGALDLYVVNKSAFFQTYFATFEIGL